MRVLDLFSGIGGFSLGLERAGMTTVAFCECEEYPRRVLAKHWPGVPIYNDVRTLTAQQLKDDGIGVDVICGGFPCQDVSLAGKGAGLDGERSGLWFEFARLVREIRPEWVIIENDVGLLHRGMDRVLNSLADVGYDAEWDRWTACSVGLPHARRRLYAVAYPASRWGQQRRRLKLAPGSNSARHLHNWQHQPEPPRVATGLPHRMDRNWALGNSLTPRIPELLGRAIMAAR